MVQELLPFLPPALTTTQAGLCVALVMVGIFLWMAGAVWSRGILTLIAVAVGGTLGDALPRWQSWPINSMAAAVLGAVILGVCAFMLSRLWVGILLGVMLSTWVALAAWMVLRGGASWPWREPWEVANMSVPEHLKDMWFRLPDTIRKPLPYGAGTAMISALGLALLFPRIGRVTCFSVTGVTIVFAAGLTLVASRRPDWLIAIPPRVDVQAGALGGLVLLGMILQWQFLPSKRGVDPERAKSAEQQAIEQEPMPSSGPHKYA
jgi:hypothetical protein